MQTYQQLYQPAGTIGPFDDRFVGKPTFVKMLARRRFAEHSTRRIAGSDSAGEAGGAAAGSPSRHRLRTLAARSPSSRHSNDRPLAEEAGFGLGQEYQVEVEAGRLTIQAT